MSPWTTVICARDVLCTDEGDIVMKWGPRKPSLKGMIAARLSPARFIRHNLGLKAPRGFGWVTDPKKALYNRIYSRLTFSIFDLFKRPK